LLYRNCEERSNLLNINIMDYFASSQLRESRVFKSPLSQVNSVLWRLSQCRSRSKRKGCSVYLMLNPHFGNFIPELLPFAVCFVETS